MARIEFYANSSDRYMASCDDGAVPRTGEYINIRRVTYKVDRVTWAVDHDDIRRGAALRANVELVEAKP